MKTRRRVYFRWWLHAGVIIESLAAVNSLSHLESVVILFSLSRVWRDSMAVGSNSSAIDIYRCWHIVVGI